MSKIECEYCQSVHHSDVCQCTQCGASLPIGPKPPEHPVDFSGLLYTGFDGPTGAYRM